MKHKYILLLLATFTLVKGYSQNCTSLGCAANFGAQIIDATVADAVGDPGTCYDGFNYKQVYWQFFYSPFGGDFTQTYTPTSTGDPLDLDYIVFDMGLSGPASVTCPVNTSGFTEVFCSTDPTANLPTGPGIEGTVTTIATHFYAIAIYAYQDVDPTYTFDIGNPQLNGADLDALNCPGVLPVKLSSFDAQVSNCIVALTWEAQSESSFKHYEVEYSSDGRTFQSIAILSPAHNVGAQKYAYVHNDPQQGNIYYRLKMSDIDGRSTYSKTIVMKIDCSRSSLIVYPNPVTDMLNINLANAEGNPTARLLDNNGKLIYMTTLKSGTNMINMMNFSKGIYILSIQNNKESQNIKIIK
jgi:hypothetical protein